MSTTIELYFDFSSPYAYLASERIEAIAEKHNCLIDWRPFLLGAAFKISGQRPLVDVPLMRNYTINDLQRCAREHHIPFTLPDPFPIATINAARSVYWLRETAPEKVNTMIHALFRNYFVDGHNISEVDKILSVAESIEVDPAELAHALQTPEIKQKLKDAVSDAIERGIFGTPCFVIDGEQFWGNDRVDQLDKWLERGGW